MSIGANKVHLQNGRAGQVATVTEVRSSHHVLGVEHLLSELRDGNGTELLAATSSQGGEAGHEEVETRERN